MEIFTIGHSTHTEEEFLRLLNEYGIELLADVRAFPGSRKCPQFSIDHLPNWLGENQIDYEHFRRLGGRRRKSKDVDPEINGGWNNQSFHNYADYTLTEEFQQGIDDLTKEATVKRVAYCCSERHPARCHRLLISNWLTAQGWKVRHIIDGNKGEIDVVDHELGKWGAKPVVLSSGIPVYPKSDST